jgi:hypothetical protein
VSNSAERVLLSQFHTLKPHGGDEPLAYLALVLQLLSAGNLVGDSGTPVAECIAKVKELGSDSRATRHFASALSMALRKEQQGQ